MRSAPTNDGFREALLEGLAHRPRKVPCRYLYDATGSALFDRITELEEYYLTRAETALLAAHCPEVAAMVGPGVRVIELGAGSMVKTRLLLSVLQTPAGYVPVDVSREALLLAARRLGAQYPDLSITPLVADFTQPLALPAADGRPALVFFPGSTIGNLRPAEARDVLRRVVRAIGGDGWMLVGVDSVKDPALLGLAYDDPHGVTAAFVRNLLARANRELDADFDLDGFDHSAWWNARESRVEINLVAGRRQQVNVGGHRFAFRRGDTIHVEDCYKYAVPQMHWLARQGGFEPVRTWTDGRFSLHLLRSTPLS